MYSTVENISKKYSTALLIRLTNFDGTADDFTAIKESVLEDALQDASALIDGYLAGRYAVPVSPAPEYFESDCEAISVALMIQHKGYSTGTPDESLYLAGMKIIKDRYEMVASGKLTLPIPGTVGGVSSNPPLNIAATYPPKIFSRETLDKF